MVLLISLGLSMVVHLMLEVAWLQEKMVNHYKIYKEILFNAYSHFEVVKNKIGKSTKLGLEHEITFVQFIPDTLHVDEIEGENIYHIQKPLRNDSGAKRLFSVNIGTRKINEQKIVAKVKKNQLIIYHRDENGRLHQKYRWKVSADNRLSTPVYAQRQQLFYILSQKGTLHGINHEGNEVYSLNLALNEDLTSWRNDALEITNASLEEIEYLTVILPVKKEKLMVYAVGERNLLKKWERIVNENQRIENVCALYPPFNKSTFFVGVLFIEAQMMRFVLFDASFGLNVKEWAIPLPKPLIAKCVESIKLTKVTKNASHYTESIYFGDYQGQLWKVLLNHPLPNRIYYDPSFIIWFEDKVIVGRHPKGKGLLTYVKALNSQGEHMLLAIADEEDLAENKILFTLKFKESLSVFQLMQNRLICLSANKMWVYEAFSGLKKYDFVGLSDLKETIMQYHQQIFSNNLKTWHE